MKARRAISFCLLGMILVSAMVGFWTAFAEQPHSVAITNLPYNTASATENATTAIAFGRSVRVITPTRISSNTTESSTAPFVAKAEQTHAETMVYLSHLNYTQAALDYARSGGITTLAPQVYALDQSGNLVVADRSFNASLFVEIAHASRLKVIPLVAAGAFLCVTAKIPWCSDQGILSIADNSSQLVLFTRELVSLCRAHDFNGIQLDWESATLNTTLRPAMTVALNEIATALHDLSPQRTLSLTTILYNYQIGPYNVWSLSRGAIDEMNVQAYTNDSKLFQSTTNYMLYNSANASKIAVGLGDYSGVNPSSAGQDVGYLIHVGVKALAIWPAMGSEVSNGGYGYYDGVYDTSNFSALLSVFVAKSS